MKTTTKILGVLSVLLLSGILCSAENNTHNLTEEAQLISQLESHLNEDYEKLNLTDADKEKVISQLEHNIQEQARLIQEEMSIREQEKILQSLRCDTFYCKYIDAVPVNVMVLANLLQVMVILLPQHILDIKTRIVMAGVLSLLIIAIAIVPAVAIYWGML